MNITYKCSICGRKNVKLWRPYGNDLPLICAFCAEKRQSPLEYQEIIWSETPNGYTGEHTGKKLPVPRWTVNCEGFIPSCHGPGPKGTTLAYTDQLIINLSDVDERYSSGETTMIPAVQKSTDSFYNYMVIPETRYQGWQRMPN